MNFNLARAAREQPFHVASISKTFLGYCVEQRTSSQSGVDICSCAISLETITFSRHAESHCSAGPCDRLLDGVGRHHPGRRLPAAFATARVPALEGRNVSPRCRDAGPMKTGP